MPELEYPVFLEDNGIPIRLDSPYEAWAFDTDPPRRIPASTAIREAWPPISREEFEALVAKARAS